VAQIFTAGDGNSLEPWSNQANDIIRVAGERHGVAVA